MISLRECTPSPQEDPEEPRSGSENDDLIEGQMDYCDVEPEDHTRLESSNEQETIYNPEGPSGSSQQEHPDRIVEMVRFKQKPKAEKEGSSVPQGSKDASGKELDRFLGSTFWDYWDKSEIALDPTADDASSPNSRYTLAENDQPEIPAVNTSRTKAYAGVPHSTPPRSLSSGLQRKQRQKVENTIVKDLGEETEASIIQQRHCLLKCVRFKLAQGLKRIKASFFCTRLFDRSENTEAVATAVEFDNPPVTPVDFGLPPIPTPSLGTDFPYIQSDLEDLASEDIPPPKRKSTTWSGNRYMFGSMLSRRRSRIGGWYSASVLKREVIV